MVNLARVMIAVPNQERKACTIRPERIAPTKHVIYLTTCPATVLCHLRQPLFRQPPPPSIVQGSCISNCDQCSVGSVPDNNKKIERMHKHACARQHETGGGGVLATDEKDSHRESARERARGRESKGEKEGGGG